VGTPHGNRLKSSYGKPRIILWNYLYLSEKVFDTPEGKQRDELLHQIKYSSMASWEHINMLGEYDYSDERVNNIT
jgi:hypothetical protein